MENCFENVVSLFTKKIACVSTELPWEKNAKTKKNLNQNYENVYNLRGILGTELVLLVDF